MNRDPFAYVGESGFTIRLDAEESVEEASAATAVFTDPAGEQKNLTMSKVDDGSDGLWEADVPDGFFDTHGGWSVQLWTQFPSSPPEVRASHKRAFRISDADAPTF